MTDSGAPAFPSLLGHLTGAVLNHEVLALPVLPKKRGVPQLQTFCPLREPLPCDFHLVNLRSVVSQVGLPSRLYLYLYIYFQDAFIQSDLDQTLDQTLDQIIDHSPDLRPDHRRELTLDQTIDQTLYQTTVHYMYIYIYVQQTLLSKATYNNYICQKKEEQTYISLSEK